MAPGGAPIRKVFHMAPAGYPSDITVRRLYNPIIAYSALSSRLPPVEQALLVALRCLFPRPSRDTPCQCPLVPFLPPYSRSSMGLFPGKTPSFPAALRPALADKTASKGALRPKMSREGRHILVSGHFLAGGAGCRTAGNPCPCVVLETGYRRLLPSSHLTGFPW